MKKMIAIIIGVSVEAGLAMSAAAMPKRGAWSIYRLKIVICQK